MNMYICPRQGGRTYLEARRKQNALEAKCVMGALPSKYVSRVPSCEHVCHGLMIETEFRKKNLPPLLLFLTKVGWLGMCQKMSD